MTRINTINVKDLTDKHLLSEFRELPRLGSYIKRSLEKHNGDYKKVELEIPSEYKMGTGHVKFFYNKIGYAYRRYLELYVECKTRGFKVEFRDWLWWIKERVPKHWVKDWTPDDQALITNMNRILERLRK